MENLLQNYARLIVCRGVNVQKGKAVVVQADVEAMPFAHLLAEEAYQNGASHVEIVCSSDKLEQLQYTYETMESIKDIPAFKVENIMYYLRRDASYIRLVSQNPYNLADIDEDKRREGVCAYQHAFQERQKLVLEHAISWCIAAVPGSEWAKLVYPEKEDPVKALWECIAACCYCGQEPLNQWDRHISIMKRRLTLLNNMQLDRLCFTSKNGTDITIGLCDHHRWKGGDSITPKGVPFSPNLPSEELYTVPHRDRADGTVVSTKPMSFLGTVIEAGFQITYQGGCAVKVRSHNKQDQALLENIFQDYQGTRRLGEVALVDFDNPISRSGRLFFNTLFDENTVCHLAMGNGIQSALDANRPEESFAEFCGLNTADLHLDYMIGNRDIKCVGISKSGKQYLLMDHGNIII